MQRPGYLVRYGILILVIGFAYAGVQTKFFGGEGWLPSCAEEAICDGIAMIIVSLGLLTWAIGMACLPKKEE